MTPRRVLRLCVVLGAAGLLIACSGPIETHQGSSPDGSITLRVEIDEGGGAAVADVTSVFLIPARPSGAAKTLIFKGSAMSNFSARWRDNQTVELSYTAGYVSKCDSEPTLDTRRSLRVVGCS
jgi:hypothetical protein